MAFHDAEIHGFATVRAVILSIDAHANPEDALAQAAVPLAVALVLRLIAENANHLFGHTNLSAAS
jgi:mannose/fructose/N-acetylgalactosamine-specific phosphotransferase system component IIC